MRIIQFIGLKSEVKDKLLKLGRNHEDCPTCRCTLELEQYPGKYHAIGIAGERYELPGYRSTPLNSVVNERVQEERWSSGPVIFTALVDLDGHWVAGTLWTEEEMNKYL